MPRLLEKATNREEREPVRQFVATMELDPETREVDLKLRLPANRAIQVEAAARIGALWIGRCAWCG